MGQRHVSALIILLLMVCPVSTSVKGGQEVPPLFEVYQDFFPVGAAVTPSKLSSHGDLVGYHFNSLTAENHMKWESIQPREDEWTFAHADQLVSYAKQHDMKVRGHTLIWHQQTPDWVFEDAAGGQVSRDVLLERMQTHIKTLVGRYKGQVYAWDVVNEGIDDGSGYLRHSPWYQILGADYIRHAFRFAHEADPDAKLFYNDYSTYQPAKRSKISRLIRELQDEGIPIHGVGMQGHYDIYHPPIWQVEQAIKAFSDLGVEVQMTELDLSIFRWEERHGFEEPPAERLKLQADRYEQLFSLFRRYGDAITNVTFWGIADDDTWLNNFPVRGRKNWPTLFDDQHQPKDSFWRVVDF